MVGLNKSEFDFEINLQLCAGVFFWHFQWAVVVMHGVVLTGSSSRSVSTVVLFYQQIQNK